MGKRYNIGFGGNPRSQIDVGAGANQCSFLADCTTANIPADGKAGYMGGALLMVTDASTGISAVYQNTGSTTSCAFRPVPVSSAITDTTALTATNAEINRAADMSARIVNCTSSTLTVTEALHDGKTIVLDRAAGIAVELPVPVAGMRFRFVVKTTFTGAAAIHDGNGAIMIGHATMGNDSSNSTVDFQSVAASSNNNIDLFGTANSTGGIEGQVIEIEALSSGYWFVEIQGDAAGTEATPFSAV